MGQERAIRIDSSVQAEDLPARRTQQPASAGLGGRRAAPELPSRISLSVVPAGGWAAPEAPSLDARAGALWHGQHCYYAALLLMIAVLVWWNGL